MRNRLPLLLIAFFMLALGGAIVFFGVTAATARLVPPPGQPSTAARVASFIPLFFLGAILLGFVIWVWALVHMLTNQAIQGTDKIVWALVVIFLNILGAILYFTLSPSPKRPQSPALAKFPPPSASPSDHSSPAHPSSPY